VQSGSTTDGKTVVIITEQELNEIEKKLKNNKAPGSDGISNEVIYQAFAVVQQMSKSKRFCESEQTS
jgi:hypothetical protein